MFYLELIKQRVFKMFILQIFPQDPATHLISCCSLCIVGLDLNLSKDTAFF